MTSEGIDYDVIEVPYEGDSLSMLLVSPIEPEVPLSALIGDLSSQRIRQWRQELRRVKRQLSVPRWGHWDVRIITTVGGLGASADKNCARFNRFTLNSEVNFKSALLNMGLGDVFNLATADFTRITSKLTL